jgi:hypothetical protein
VIRRQSNDVPPSASRNRSSRYAHPAAHEQLARRLPRLDDWIPGAHGSIDLSETDLVVDQAVRLLACEQLVDEIDDAHRLVETVCMRVLRVFRLSVSTEVKPLQEVLAFDRPERQDVRRQPIEDGEFPPLEADWLRAEVREEA